MVCALIAVAAFADVIAPYGPAQIVAGGAAWKCPAGNI